MFKKNVSTSQKRQASGKDLKQLKRDIQSIYPSLSEDEIKTFLPAKCQLDILKLSNKALAYSVDGQILFFDPNGKGDQLVPAVQMLWLHPRIVPSVTTWSEVTPKILGGADLFLQGLVLENGSLPEFQEGDTMAIRAVANPFPFAVGVMEVGSQAASKNGLKGKGVKVLHTFGDHLWGLGDKAIPDSSFTTSRIFPAEEVANASSATSVPETSEGDLAAFSLESSTDAASPHSEEISASTMPSDQDGKETDSRGPTGHSELSQGSNTETASVLASVMPNAKLDPPDEVGDAPTSLSQDELAEHCLAAGLVRVKDKDLPIITSDFYSKFMVPSRPAGTAIDLKKSSYKKLSKLLGAFEKKGLLKQKATHGKEYITAVSRSHELYQGAQKDLKANPQPESLPVAQESSKTDDSKIVTTAYYRVPSSLRPFFTGVSQNARDEMFTRTQVQDALAEYVEYNGLSPDSPHAVKLDSLMISTLFNKKDPVIEGNPHPIKDLEQRLISKLQLFHHARRKDTDGNEQEVLTKGTLHPIEIQLEDRSGGRKHITRIRNFEAYTLAPDEFAAALQRKFQSSASVQDLPGKTETRKEVLLQGDVMKHISQFLNTTYGLASDQIHVIQKSKAKK